MCDDLLDNPSDLVDLGVEFLLPVQQIAMEWFLDGCDHIITGVALVAIQLVPLLLVGLF